MAPLIRDIHRHTGRIQLVLTCAPFCSSMHEIILKVSSILIIKMASQSNDQEESRSRLLGKTRLLNPRKCLFQSPFSMHKEDEESGLL